MILTIAMPIWLRDFWAIYGDMITPVLVTLTLSLLTYLALKIRSDAKVNAAKSELQIQALKEVANREDNVPELEKLAQQINTLDCRITQLTEMFNLAFQNSQLTPEIKSNLASLKNKALYGSEDDLIKELEEQKAKLQEQVDTLTAAVSRKPVKTVTEEVRTRVRR